MAELSDAINQVIKQEVVTKEPELKTDNLIDWFLGTIHLYLSAKLKPPAITFEGDVRLGTSIDVLANCTEFSFMSAYLDDWRATTKKVHSYHELHNNPSPKKQIINELLIPGLNSVISGMTPAALTTLLSSYPPVASSIGINTTQQGIMWGLGVLGATIATGYYAVKFARNPKRVSHRPRDILGTEERITDEIVLYGEDPSDQNNRYSGKQVTYRLSEKINSETIAKGDILGLRLRRWSEKYPNEPLFKVSISDSATPYTIWLVALNLKIGEHRVILNIQRNFEYGMKSILTESTGSKSWCRFEYSFDEVKSRLGHHLT